MIGNNKLLDANFGLNKRIDHRLRFVYRNEFCSAFVSYFTCIRYDAFDVHATRTRQFQANPHVVGLKF